MSSRRLFKNSISLFIILGSVTTPILAAPSEDSRVKTEGNDKEINFKSNIRSPKYYSPLVDLLSPSPWDLDVPGGPEDMAPVIYFRSPRQATFDDTDDLEAAEQILFRPLFRHRQMLADRAERLREKEALRRRLFSVEPAPRLPFSNNRLEDGFFNGRQERSV